MSIFAYNGVTLAYPHFIDFNHIPVRDPQSDTDWHLERYDIKVQTIINLDYLSTIAPDLVGVVANAAEIMQAIRYRLQLHRCQLSVTFNGKEYIPIRQGGNDGYVDAKNGPKPQLCQLFEMTNTSFLLNYHIIAHYWQNNTVPRDGTTISNNNNEGNNVLYNRWTESVEMNSTQFTTRVREGQYAIRSDNVDGKTADELRSNMAVVSVPEGFLRKSSKYTVSEDGLAIQYRVVDQEQFRMPPPPAFEAKGYYFERTNNMFANRIGEARVVLKGDAVTPQRVLIEQAVIIATNILAMRSVTLKDPPPYLFKKGWSVLDDAGLKFSLYENEVEFYMRVWAAVDVNRYYGITAFFDISTFVPGSSDEPDYTPTYFDRGTAGFLLQAAAYYDPNLRDTSLGGGVVRQPQLNEVTTTGGEKVQLTRGRQPGQAGANP